MGGDVSQRRGSIAYSEKELLFGLKLINKLEDITDIMLYFLDKQHIIFSYILICADDKNFESFLREEKRDTDILVPIDVEKNLYAIICQETDTEGGYRFAERIIRLLANDEHRECLHCNVLTVTSTHYSPREIIFRLLEDSLPLSEKDTAERCSQIEFHTLS